MAAKNDSLWNWFGRQVGHVKKAVKTNVVKPAALPKAPAEEPHVAPPPPTAPEAP